MFSSSNKITYSEMLFYVPTTKKSCDRKLNTVFLLVSVNRVSI